MSRTQVYGTLAAEQTVALEKNRDLVLSAGARYDNSNRYGSQTSPLASIELRQKESALTRVYLSYDESTQLPTYTALNNKQFFPIPLPPAQPPIFAGDPNLPRATAANLELGTEASLAGWKTQAAVFYRQDENLLDYVFDPSGALSTSRRAAPVNLDTYGVEFFVQRSWARFDLVAGYTYLRKDDNYTAPLNGSFYALNYAEHRLTIGGLARLGAGFELRMDNELRRQADNPLRLEGHDNINSALGIFYSVPRVKGLTLNAQVANLWDTAFQDVPLVPASRREWSVGATYVW
jgi:hypothetical protein